MFESPCRNGIALVSIPGHQLRRGLHIVVNAGLQKPKNLGNDMRNPSDDHRSVCINLSH